MQPNQQSTASNFFFDFTSASFAPTMPSTMLSRPGCFTRYMPLNQPPTASHIPLHCTFKSASNNSIYPSPSNAPSSTTASTFTSAATATSSQPTNNYTSPVDTSSTSDGESRTCRPCGGYVYSSYKTYVGHCKTDKHHNNVARLTGRAPDSTPRSFLCPFHQDCEHMHQKTRREGFRSKASRTHHIWKYHSHKVIREGVNYIGSLSGTDDAPNDAPHDAPDDAPDDAASTPGAALLSLPRLRAPDRKDEAEGR